MGRHEPGPGHDRPRLCTDARRAHLGAPGRRHLSRPQLALLVGASLSSVKNWEGDRATPSPGYLSSLEEALGVQFVDDGDGRYHALDAAPAVDAPRVVVVVAGTAEAMEAALDRLGVPRAE
jgi:transcriptional regulator with XRE-family HTH domain